MWVAVGVGAASTVAGMIGASKAAKGQQQAANQAIAAQQAQYQQNRTDNLPALDARNNSLMMLQQKAGQYSAAPTADQVMATPGYQFGLNQGNNNIENSAASRGGLYSGAAGKALTRYGTDYATTKYQNAFDNLQTSQTNDFNHYLNIGNLGQAGASSIANAGQNMVNANNQTLMSNANSQGAANIAQSNLIAGGLNQFGSWAKSPNGQDALGGLGDRIGGWFAPSNSNGSVISNSPTYIDPSSKYAQNGSDFGWNPIKRADGGPVRAEPVVGSRSPVRTGGGGGFSPNALLALVMAHQLPQTQTAPGGDYLMNPGQIVDQRMRQAGAYAMGGAVHGPGGPRDDLIPAQLSSGEHVFDTASVDAVGGGDNEVGQNRLNKLREILKNRR